MAEFKTDWFKPIGQDIIEIPKVAQRQDCDRPNTTYKRPHSKRKLIKRKQPTEDEKVQKTVTQLFDSVKPK